MTKTYMTLMGLIVAATMWAADGISYDGTKLTLCEDFTRTECGTMSKNTMKETSGMACSRQTPGYLWALGDENTGDNRKIVAVTPSGALTMTAKITSSGSDRDDWEDIATGVYNGQNYLFIGAIGDNNCQFNDAYYIYYVAEPAIASGTVTLNVNYIRFGYPDNQAHNTETLMYDNIEQRFYIADKVDGVCHLYYLPFRTDYGTSVQRLTEVCALGNGSKFKEATGGDITPDGKWMAIKNEKYVLLWERQGTESLTVTAQRRPEQIAAYEEETQGESLAWADPTTFYTTSDAKKDTPMYRYVRKGFTPPDNPPMPTDTITTPTDTLPTPPALYEAIMTNSYSAYLNGNTLQAFYLAGEDAPRIESYHVNEGTAWEQNGNVITLTGTDSSMVTYSLVTAAVLPCVFTSDEIVFDGSETWVKGAYGFDETKKWRISKTDDDYSREIAGKTHLELFLPACDTVELASSITSYDRDIRVYANGNAVGGKVKLPKGGTLTMAVLQSAPFMLTVASAQSSGDAGIKSIRLARHSYTTNLQSPITDDRSPSINKVLRNGMLLIERDGKTYNATGAEVK